MKLNLNTEKKVRIEMLPLIDVVFLLLVFFIYAMLSMSVHRGLQIALPTSSSAIVEKELRLSVTVKKDGKIFLDKEPVNLKDLTSTLQEKAFGRIEPGVLLFADQNLPYQKLFRVLDQIRMAGLSKISLQAEACK